MGVFDDIPTWARLPSQVAIEPPRKAGRPKGAKDSKPRTRMGLGKAAKKEAGSNLK
jgi:hypothetical protein